MAQINRQITVKGDFKRAVIINDTLVNGEECSFDDSNSSYSHAEGYKSEAKGKYSHADGVKAEANKDYSYVWSGVNPSTTIHMEAPQYGTFSLFTEGYNASPECSSAGLNHVYINGASVSNIADYYKQQAITTIRTSENMFTDSLYLSGHTTTKNFELSDKIKMVNNGTAEFKNTVTFTGDTFFNKVKNVNTNDKSLATCEFVHKVVQEYLKNIFGDDIFKEESSS